MGFFNGPPYEGDWSDNLIRVLGEVGEAYHVRPSVLLEMEGFNPYERLIADAEVTARFRELKMKSVADKGADSQMEMYFQNLKSRHSRMMAEVNNN